MNKKLISILTFIFALISLSSSLADTLSTLDKDALFAYTNAYNIYFDKENYPLSMNSNQTDFSIFYEHKNSGFDSAYDITISYSLKNDNVSVTLLGDALSSELTDIVFYTDDSICHSEQINSLYKSHKTWNFIISGNSFWNILASDIVTIRVKHDDSISFLNLFSDEDSSIIPSYMLAIMGRAYLYSDPTSELYKATDLLPEISAANESSPKTVTTSFSQDYIAINETAQSMFLVEVYDNKDQCIATGSGFVAFDGHYFVTNQHVIDGSAYIIIYDDSGKNKYKLTNLLIADEKLDVAILQFDQGFKYKSLEFDSTSTLLRGQPIVVIGSPQGVKNTVSNGIISAFVEDNGISSIQFTAAISPGSSGGALFNDDGKIIGLVYAKLKESENMNYALTIEHVENLVKNINTVHYQTLKEYNAKYFITPTPKPTLRPTPKPTLRPTPTPTRKATPTPTRKSTPKPKAIPLLQIPDTAYGEWQWVDSNRINFRVQLENTSSYSYISSYTLCYTTLKPSTITTSFYESVFVKTKTFDQYFGPGTLKYSGYFPVTLNNSSTIYVGIKKIVFSTGNVKEYSFDEIDFSAWTIH